MQIPPQLMTLPNQLTIGRILAIPVICLFLVSGWEWLRWLALLLYIAAAVTDWLDGFLARQMNLNSALGKMLDPIADKLLVGALLITFAWTRDLNGWDLIPAIAIMLREIFVSGLPRQVEDHRTARGARPDHRRADAARARLHQPCVPVDRRRAHRLDRLGIPALHLAASVGT